MRGVHFSRNFRKEAAIFAGLQAADGDCVAVIDCDLQHPPEKLVEMYRLWEQGVITAASTQRETAWAYYQWIAANCVYDDAGDNTSVSHLPYSVFHNGKAVCDGYTGAYNLLLKLEGIDCYALPNATHIWTVAVLDGKTVHIDATWGDQGATAAEEYFAMTPEQSYTLHPWPKENERPD